MPLIKYQKNVIPGHKYVYNLIEDATKQDATPGSANSTNGEKPRGRGIQKQSLIYSLELL